MIKLALLDWTIIGLVALGLATLITLTINHLLAKFRRNKLLEQGNSNKKTKNIATLLASFTVLNSEQVMQKFINAGFYHFPYPHLYLPAKLILLLLTAVLLSLFGSQQFVFNLLIFMFILMMIIIIPDVYLEKRAKSLADRVSGNLSYLLDLMAICVQTGMTIEASMAYLSKEIADFNDDLCYLLQRTTQRAKLVGLENALDELNERIDSTEMRSFVNTLNQSLKFGTSIYEVLTGLSQDIREIQMLNLEEKVGKLSAKMSVPLILFIMFPIVILIVTPGILRMMNNG